MRGVWRRSLDGGSRRWPAWRDLAEVLRYAPFVPQGKQDNRLARVRFRRVRGAWWAARRRQIESPTEIFSPQAIDGHNIPRRGVLGSRGRRRRIYGSLTLALPGRRLPDRFPLESVALFPNAVTRPAVNPGHQIRSDGVGDATACAHFVFDVEIVGS